MICSQVISLQVSNDGFINKLLVLHMITWVVIATFFLSVLVRIIDLNIYVPINVNLEGLVGGPKAGNLNSKQFFGSNAQPQGHHNNHLLTNYWSKEDKFPTSPTKTRGQKCFIERKNILTFWGSHIRFFQQTVSGFSSNFWIALNSLTFGNKAIWSYVIWQYEGVAAFVSFRGPSLQRGKQGSTKQNDMFNTTKKWCCMFKNKEWIKCKYLSFLDMPLFSHVQWMSQLGHVFVIFWISANWFTVDSSKMNTKNN